MAKIVHIKSFGVQSMITEITKQAVEKNITILARDLGKQGFIPFNIKTYIKQSGQVDYPYNLNTIGVKCDAVYLGSDWGYWKILTRQIIKDWWSNFSYKYIRNPFIKDE